ncbi:MAG: 2-dehydro-3-deoxy-D-gluconate 5-dehydrogenase KduD [Acidobacteria bacterium]|nr:MAG: 2-dehydro-3-deoxy-D-gluconate 5-dehydrogenase KduD [Acidobacteriota bacterium]
MTVAEQFRLNGKVALVTGCGRPNGLGFGMAQGLAEAGADIAGIDVGDLDEAGSLIKQTGRRFFGMREDLTVPGCIDKVVHEILETLGRIDILVNNAGIIRRSPAVDFSEKDWDDILQVNLKTVFFLSQAVTRVFLAQRSGGKIINIASMLSFQGGINVPAYTASKSAVAGITRALACEWAKCGINVNAIAPGYMATDNTAPLRADASRSAAILDRIPAARWGENSDLKGAVVFLASPASDYVHGHILAVDGGWLAR